MSRRVLVISPTYNERTNLPVFLSAVFAAAPEVDVLVIDDNSPDGTGDVADAAAADDPRVKVIHREGKLGLGTAYLKGFAWAMEHGYDVVFEMDADMSHDPKYIPDFLRALDAGADIVIGSRNIPGGGVEGWGLGRHVLSKGGSIYSRVILGIDVRDLTSGFKAFTRRALEVIELGAVQSNGYSFQIELTFRALLRGLKVTEVPIWFVDRVQGHSKMSRTIFAEAVLMVWKLRADALLGRM